MEIETYAENCGIIGHRRLVLLGSRRTGLDTEVLYIAATENDILVDLVGGGHFLIGIALATLSSE